MTGKEQKLKDRRKARYEKRYERNAELQRSFPPSIQRIHASHITLSKEKG